MLQKPLFTYISSKVLKWSQKMQDRHRQVECDVYGRGPGTSSKCCKSRYISSKVLKWSQKMQDRYRQVECDVYDKPMRSKATQENSQRSIVTRQRDQR